VTFLIRFPLGLLATALGYAGAGAAVALALIPDFLGHLPRLLLLCAIGAALLGLVAWPVSERLADHVNLNTRPLKRLALGCAAGVLVATLLAGSFGEFAIGTPVAWVEPAMVALYVAAGLPAALAVLALVAALETMAAARRGGAPVLDSVRPLVRPAVGAALLAGAIGYGLAEHRDLARQSLAALAPDMPRASAWGAGQQALFAGVLASLRCEVLVAPMEARDASVDRVARSLMTRLLAAELSARGLCVADPTLVARALGPTRRRLDERALLALARALAAQTVIRSEVTTEPELGRFGVSIAVLERHGDSLAQVRSVELPPTAFSDRLPPEAAFAASVASIAQRLDLSGDQGAEADDAAGAVASLPADPLLLAGDAGGPVLRALRLQLLASTYAPDDVAGEHLSERALIALRGLDDEPARVLRAGAALHLHRRPYALALLDGLQSPQAQAVRAAAQGDLATLEATPRAEVDPAFWLLTRVEAERLREAYGASAGFEARREAALEPHRGYQPWLGTALSPAPARAVGASPPVVQSLERLGVDLPASTAAWPLEAAATLGWVPAEVRDASVYDLERGYAALWAARGASWLAERADDRLAQWDLFDALFAADRAAVAAFTSALASADAEPGPAVRAGRLLALRSGGEPGFSAWMARVLAAAGAGEEPGSGLETLRAAQLARDVVAWEGGEGRAARVVATLAPEPPPDQPRRAWRHAAAAGHGPAEHRLASLLSALQLTQTEFDYLERAHGLLRELGREEEAARLLADHQARFAGHPARERFLLARAADNADLPALIDLLQGRLRATPQAWEARLQLARAQLRARELAAAERTLLEDPVLARPQSAGAELAGRGLEAGALLHEAGEAERAAVLYERAAVSGGEAPAALLGGQRLAHVKGEFGAARDRAQQHYDGNGAGSALADVAYYAFLMGDADRGWRAFYEASRVAQDFRPWSAALAGHRIAASRHDDAVKFAQLWNGVSPAPQADALRKEHFVFNYAFVDRAPGEPELALLRGFAGKSGNERYQLSGEVYAAWLRGDHARVASLLGAPPEQSLSAAAVPHADRAHLLPYLVFTLARSARERDARAALTVYLTRGGQDFYQLLARAYLEGMTGKRELAAQLLWDAMLARPDGADRSMPAGFQLLEACAQLYQVTGEAAYRDLLLDLARRQQRVWPDSWAFAFEARYAQDAAARQRALAFALYLDPKSEQLRAVPDAERKHAQQWLAQHKPF
jgi:hypothetical protein